MKMGFIFLDLKSLNWIIKGSDSGDENDWTSETIEHTFEIHPKTNSNMFYRYFWLRQTGLHAEITIFFVS